MSDNLKFLLYYLKTKLYKVAIGKRKFCINKHAAQNWVKKLTENHGWDIMKAQTTSIKKKPVVKEHGGFWQKSFCNCDS
jgi:hypothetical protein